MSTTKKRIIKAGWISLIPIGIGWLLDIMEIVDFNELIDLFVHIAEQIK